VTDPAEPQRAQEPPVDAVPVRASRWRWAAPLVSVAVLSWLVARVTTCDEPVAPQPKLLSTGEPPADAADTPDDLVPLRGTKSFGIAAPGEKAAAAEPAVAVEPAVEPALAPDPVVADPAQPHPLVGEDLRFLGGSKSGFGGLGRTGTGRVPLGEPTLEGSPPEPAP